MDEHKVVTQVCASIDNYYRGDEIFFDLPNAENVSDLIFNISDSEVCVDFNSCNSNFSDTTCFSNLLRGFLYSNDEDEPNLTVRRIIITVS